jgi:hypothetical protein
MAKDTRFIEDMISAIKNAETGITYSNKGYMRVIFTIPLAELTKTIPQNKIDGSLFKTAISRIIAEKVGV